MTEPDRPRPVPGPPRPGPEGGAVPVDPVPAQDPPPGVTADVGPFAGLSLRPVAEHVAAFEAEHARLQRELGTIDQL